MSGVLQGCPLSDSLFVITIDPLLHFSKKQLEDSAPTSCRACADDIGMASKRMSTIPLLCKWFEDYSIISGLTLSPSKCIIVLTSFLVSAANQEVIRSWLSEVCPSWKDMKICNVAKYLGFFLGPCATPLQWTKALAKFQDRISNIHTGHLPAFLSRAQYVFRALPTLGYAAQLVEAPMDIIRVGLNSVIKVMRLAGNSLSFRTAFFLDSSGGPNLLDIAVYLQSCLIRTACKTASGHEVLHNSLTRVGLEALSFTNHRYAHAIPPGWERPAFCTTLGAASRLLPQELSRSSIGPPLAVSLQAKIYKLLSANEEAKNFAWRKLLGDRLCSLCSVEFEDLRGCHEKCCGPIETGVGSEFGETAETPNSPPNPFLIMQKQKNPFVHSHSHLWSVWRVLLILGHGPRLCVIKTLPPHAEWVKVLIWRASFVVKTWRMTSIIILNVILLGLSLSPQLG